MSEPLSDDDLRAIEARAAAATSGPWEACVEDRDHSSGESFIQTGGLDDEAPDMYVSLYFRTQRFPAPAPDLDFIAAARQDIPRLVDEIRRIRES